MNKEMQEWVDGINKERQELIDKKFLQGLRKKERVRLAFCNNVIEIAYPAVSLEDYKLLDDMEKRHNERKTKADRMMKKMELYDP